MKTFATILFALLTGISMAQELIIPDKFEPAKASDYKEYEEEVLICIEWLKDTPMQESRETRKLANAFLLQWISGSPSVQIELREQVMSLVENNPDLLAIYLGGWTQYSLVTPELVPALDGHIKGMEAAVEFYEKNKAALNRDRGMEKLIKLKEKGKMNETLERNWG
jgi:hypothetical protein